MPKIVNSNEALNVTQTIKVSPGTIKTVKAYAKQHKLSIGEVYRLGISHIVNKI